jgi:hypothetical protein
MLSPLNGAADRDWRRVHQKRRRDNQCDAGSKDEIVGLPDQRAERREPEHAAGLPGRMRTPAAKPERARHANAGCGSESA